MFGGCLSVLDEPIRDSKINQITDLCACFKQDETQTINV